MAYKVNPLKRIKDIFLIKTRWRKYKFGKQFHAGKHVRLWAKNKIIFGDYCYVGKYSQIECDAEIGNYVFFANNVALVGKYDHNYEQTGRPILYSQRIKDCDYNWKGLNLKVVIEDDVWIGFGSIIVSGVRIGKGSIIAAGSVVTKDIQPFTISAGVPAKKIGDRFSSKNDLEKHLELYQFFKI